MVLLDCRDSASRHGPALPSTPSSTAAPRRHARVVPRSRPRSSPPGTGGYAARARARRRPPWSKMVLVAPTWRGPLPAVLGSLPPPTGRSRPSSGRADRTRALSRGTTAKRLESTCVASTYTDPGYVTGTVVREKRARAEARRPLRAGRVRHRRARSLSHARRDARDPAAPPVRCSSSSARTRRKGRCRDGGDRRRAGVRARRVPGALLPHEKHPDATARRSCHS